MNAVATTGYRPHPARIAAIAHEAADVRTFALAVDERGSAFAAAAPGQFVMLSIFGFGEAAFTISGLAGTAGGTPLVELTVRRVGSLTSALFGLTDGDRVGLRGPFGSGFTVARDAPTVYIAGGCGLSPLKRAIELQLAARAPGVPIAIVYGARTPAERIHRTALAAWRRERAATVLESVDLADPAWAGARGPCTDLVGEAVAAIGATRAAISGPPAMMRTSARLVRSAGLAADRVELAIERHMKCGTGHCGHCYVDGRYACRDGPVFALAELDRLPDAFGALERRTP